MSAAALFLIGSLCLAVTAQAQTCSRPVGGPNMGLKGDDILLEAFPDGTQVSFACDVGYTRAGGSPVIICTAGSWSPVKLICERKNCGSVGEVANGVVDYPQGTEFGDKAVITCNPGYTLVGRKEITCLDQGWDSRLPTCEEMTCDPPPAVTDATFSPDKETYGYREVVQYRCKSGYTLNGTEHLLCSDGGRFTPDPPACVKVQCYEPNIANAEWQSGSRPPYGHKSVVTYKCKTGYDMKGESTLTCGIDSQWSPKLPTCQRKNCGTLGEVANAVAGCPQGNQFGDKAVITCNKGYTLVGRKEITCLDQGWDSRLPTCEEMTCDPPPAVTDATFSPDKETYGYREVVQYRCKSGYTLNGTEHLLCSDGGRFTPDPPACVKVQCYEPNIANAEWQSGSRPPYGHKSVVTYKCKTGYDMKGESTLTCGIDSQWSPKLPTCQKIELPKTTTTAATITTTTTTTTSVSPKKPTGTDDPETPKGKGNTPLVLGIVIPIVIVIVLGLVIFMVRKKRG